MSVNPGFGGQTFIASAVEKVAELKAMIAPRAIRIAVDGGIDPETSGLVAAAGADTFVAGTAIFKGGPEHYAANIAAIRTTAARMRRRDAA
jgi:ribulose-phosphate 3-epimerase